jgi:hypothetical protein
VASNDDNNNNNTESPKDASIAHLLDALQHCQSLSGEQLANIAQQTVDNGGMIMLLLLLLF